MEVAVTACSVAAVGHAVCGCRTRTVVSLMFSARPGGQAEFVGHHVARHSLLRGYPSRTVVANDGVDLET